MEKKLKQKQIEEMAIQRKLEITKDISNGIKGVLAYEIQKLAEHLIRLNYVKIPENAVVVKREEYEELQKGVKTYNYTAVLEEQSLYRWEQGYIQGSKETAERFAERFTNKIDDLDITVDEETLENNVTVNNVLDLIDEIAKEFTEGKKCQECQTKEE